ncbi:MAG: NAD(P)-dependent alcohol dehydrogenase, partial [Myxococcales bacterium]|nr:NAD(P)-dependent alcohol dehydrogenase [Myxococcales bacterium]
LAAQTALQSLRDIARVGPGDRVLINGGSGGVGVFAIQLAKYLGAHVTTTSSGRNTGLCRELGADRALDYELDPVLDGRERYRVIFDVVGNRRFRAIKSCLDERGVYVSTVPSAPLLFDVATTAFGYPRARLVVIRSRTRDLATLSDLFTRGLLRPLVDRIVAFDEVPSGFERLETKRARGKIAVRVS